MYTIFDSNILLQLVCERSDVFASACGVARAYPLYSRKTAACSSSDHNVTVEVILVGSGDSPLSEDDIRVSCHVQKSIKNYNSNQDFNLAWDILLLLLLVSFLPSSFPPLYVVEWLSILLYSTDFK